MSPVRYTAQLERRYVYDDAYGEEYDALVAERVVQLVVSSLVWVGRAVVGAVRAVRWTAGAVGRAVRFSLFGRID